jgi:hypothetical protein
MKNSEYQKTNSSIGKMTAHVVESEGYRGLSRQGFNIEVLREFYFIIGNDGDVYAELEKDGLDDNDMDGGGHQ